MARSAREGGSSGAWHFIGSSCTSGFYSFGVVAILFVPSADTVSSHWYWLGVAALVGLMGKEQDLVAKFLLSKAGVIFNVGPPKAP
jgi:hypothetical protein